jgi:hypothetical protein
MAKEVGPMRDMIKRFQKLAVVMAPVIILALAFAGKQYP